jgi:hypothetical protein
MFSRLPFFGLNTIHRLVVQNPFRPLSGLKVIFFIIRFRRRAGWRSSALEDRGATAAGALNKTNTGVRCRQDRE